MLRQAQIAKYLNLLYEDAFQDWQKKRHDQLLDIARHALALHQFRVEKMPPGATSLETFADFRDWKASHPDEAESYQRQFDEAATLKFLKEPKTSKEVRNLAFAHFCRTFPDAFFVSERGPYFDPNLSGPGRLLTAGFHLMQGYFRDDAPLRELVLDESGRRELDALWHELNFVTLVPLRQYKDFIFFERAEPPRYMGRAEFDFARSEDKEAAPLRFIPASFADPTGANQTSRLPARAAELC